MRIPSPLAGEGWGEGLYESQAPSPQSSPVEGEEEEESDKLPSMMEVHD